jgi:hypothetical protein
MATYAIDGVRINPVTNRLTHVRWSLVDPKTNIWLSPVEVVEVIEVVDAIHASDVVWSLFSAWRNAISGAENKGCRAHRRS